MAQQQNINIENGIIGLREAIRHIQDEIDNEDENDDANLLVRENARPTVTDRLFEHIRQRLPGRGGRHSKKHLADCRRRRSSKSRKARATRRK
jgi:hypothetical protein